MLRSGFQKIAVVTSQVRADEAIPGTGDPRGNVGR